MKYKKFWIVFLIINVCMELLIWHTQVTDWITGYVMQHGWLMLISQVAITMIGVPAIYLSQSLDRNTRRWASVLGLGGQPFWYMMAYATSGWGVFVMSLFYTYAWWTGFKNYWLVAPDVNETIRVLDDIKVNMLKLSNGQLQRLKITADAMLYKRVDEEI